MISDNFIILIILFVLIYVFEDSFFALMVLWAISIYQISQILSTNILEKDVNMLFLYVVILAYATVSWYWWTVRFNFDGTPKEKNRA